MGLNGFYSRGSTGITGLRRLLCGFAQGWRVGESPEQGSWALSESHCVNPKLEMSPTVQDDIPVGSLVRQRDHSPQPALGQVCPLEALAQWQLKQPELFVSEFNNPPGFDIGLTPSTYPPAARPL